MSFRVAFHDLKLPEGFSLQRNLLSDSVILRGPNGFTRAIDCDVDPQRWLDRLREAIAEEPGMARRFSHQEIEIHPVSIQ